MFSCLLRIAFFVNLGLPISMLGAVRVSPVFSSHAVLQRNKPVTVWGKANPHEKVTVSLGTISLKVKANSDSSWQVVFPAQAAGGPFVLKLKASNTLLFDDIYFGEVWLASGQSNMEWKLKQDVNNWKTEVENANYPLIRFLDVKNIASSVLKSEIESQGWSICNKENASEFSAIAYFFARDVFQKLNIPIGLVQCEWGGTPSEAWTSKEALAPYPEFNDQIADLPNIERSSPANASFQATLKRFNEALQKHDLGTKEQWWKNTLPATENNWKEIELPAIWANAELSNFDGVVWFRKEFELKSPVPDEEELILKLAKIDNMDSTWINGVKVGGIRNFDRNRNYNLPKGLLKEGKNTIAIRVVDWEGKGGFWGDKDLFQIAGKKSEICSLAGIWTYKIGSSIQNIPILGDEKRLFMMATSLYNGMLHPLFQLSIQGVIWYQGETNAAKAKQYQSIFPAMIKDWRAKFNQGDFPFLYVQLANYMKPEAEPKESSWAELREAQTMTLSLPKTGMALAIDIGEALDIHPKNKQDVGKRLANLALSDVYGMSLPGKSLMFSKTEKVGSTLKVSFLNLYDGLKVKDKYGYIKGFAIAGVDKKFVWANAQKEGNSIVVSAPNITEPLYVRYAWANNPDDANVYNSADLPLCPFRTD